MNRCCCFSLETGALIIGVLEIIGGIIGVIITTILLSIGTIAGQELNKPNSKLFPKSAYGENVMDEKTRQEAEVGLSLMIVVCVVFLIISCIQVLISSILIHGIRKKSNSLMTVWMTFKVIFIVLLLLMFLVSCFISFSVFVILFYLLLIGLSSFYVKVVHDFKNQSSPDSSHNVQSVGLPSYMNLNKA